MKMEKPEKYLLGLQYFAENDGNSADPVIGAQSATVETNDASASVISELTKTISAMREELDLLKPKASKAEEFQTAYQSVVSELEKTKALQDRNAKKSQLEQGIIIAMQEYNIPVEKMEGIVNSYTSEDDLLNSLGSTPEQVKAALRAYHWEEIAENLTSKTKPLEIGSNNKIVNSQSVNNGAAAAKEFLANKKSNQWI